MTATITLASICCVVSQVLLISREVRVSSYVFALIRDSRAVNAALSGESCASITKQWWYLYCSCGWEKNVLGCKSIARARIATNSTGIGAVQYPSAFTNRCWIESPAPKWWLGMFRNSYANLSPLSRKHYWYLTKWIRSHCCMPV